MSKMKFVYSTREVPHLWMHRAQPSAQNHNKKLYFEDDGSIMSYARHFVIARHTTDARGKPCILFTTRSYSNTTAQHMSLVRQAIPAGYPVYYVAHPENCVTPQDVEASLKKLIAYRDSIPRMRKNWTIALDHYRDELGKLKAFAKAFKIPLRYKEPKAFTEFIGIVAKKEAELEAQRTWELEHPTEVAEKRAAAAAKRLALAEKKFKKELAEWLAGERTSLPRRRFGTVNGGFDWAYLRIRPGHPGFVETSQGAWAPTSHVVLAMPLVLRHLKQGKRWNPDGHTVHLGNFALSAITEAGTVIAGCHHFQKEEVLRFAEVLKNMKGVANEEAGND